jgi:hypothetical protein
MVGKEILTFLWWSKLSFCSLKQELFCQMTSVTFSVAFSVINNNTKACSFIVTLLPGGLFYKTLCGRNLQIYVIS